MGWMQLFVREFWVLTQEMAPYLLLGFAAAAALRYFLDPSWVQRHLGGQGSAQVVKASLFGVPLPLCSCGVIPVAAGLRRQGGSPGAVAAFTASTPQTGVDSIAATWALLGPVFAVVRVVVAFVSGILAGLGVNRWAGDRPRNASATTCGCHPPKPAHSCCQGSPKSASSACCASEVEEPATTSCCHEEHAPAHEPTRTWGAALRFGFYDLPRDIGRSLLLGLVVAALLAAFLPDDFLGGWFSSGVLAYVAASLVAVPLYVCSTGSIPLAYAFLEAGLSPGATLLFLIVGPATNVATVVALRELIGTKGTAIYLAALLFCGVSAGVVLDLSDAPLLLTGAHHHGEERSWIYPLSAILLLALLAVSWLGPRWTGRPSVAPDPASSPS